MPSAYVKRQEHLTEFTVIFHFYKIMTTSILWLLPLKSMNYEVGANMVLLGGAETFRSCNPVRCSLNCLGSVLKGTHGILVSSYLCVSWLTL